MAGQHKIIALDLAKSTGWAAWRNGTIVSSGTKKFNETDFGDLAVSYMLWLEKLLDEYEPDLVVYEAPVVKHPHATKVLIGLSWLVLLACKERNIPCESVGNTAVKKHFVGKVYGKNAKPYPGIIEARRRGFDPQTTDEADAIAIAFYVADKITSKSGSGTTPARKPAKRK